MFSVVAKYYRYAFLAVVAGLLFSGLAYTVMGRNFGFENVKPIAVAPGFVVGFLAASVITVLVLRSRSKLVERIRAEQRIASELNSEASRRSDAEAALQETDERYRVITDEVSTGILVHREGTLLFANPAAVTMFGARTTAELLGHDPLNLVHPEDRGKVRHSREERITRQKHLDDQHIRRLRLDGSEFWSAGHARNVTFDGQPATVVVIRDVTEQVLLDRELRTSRERFQNFAESSADWFWEIDAELRITYISESIERIIGVPPQWFIGKSRVEMAHDDADKELWAAHLADLQARRPFRNLEYLRRGDGEARSRWIRSSGVPVFDEAGTFLGYHGSASDITEYKQAEERLRLSEEKLAQAQKLETVGQLTGGIAHDFNNLLAVIQGNAEILGDDPSGEKAPVQAILRAAKRGSELTQRLLAYSRKQPLRPRPLDLSLLIASLDNLLVRTLGETIDIEASVPDDLWPVLADPGQVENAILNLSINARDAMPGGGKLTIECLNVSMEDSDTGPDIELGSGDYVVLAVSDTGRGMSRDVVEQAFEPFFTTKDVGQGSGLGLSMVFGFARQSGGDVTIYSEEGRGTVVKVYLPVAQREVEPAITHSPDSAPQGNGETILVIEDDAAVRVLAVRMLRSLGYETLEVTDAAGAEKILARGIKPDLVLTDVGLPGGVSGPEFADLARARVPEIQIVYMSGYPDKAARRTELLSTESILLNKPFQRRELAIAIHDALA